MLAHFSHHVIGSLLTPLSPYISKSFNLDKAGLGVLGTAYNLPYGISQLPAGFLTDRYGPRILILVGISGVALAGVLVGISPSYVMVAVSLALLGIIGGGYHTAASPLVSGLVSPENRGSALGLHQIGGTSSFFLTPLIAVGVANALGWRGTFIALSIPIFLLGIVLYVILGRRGYRGKPASEDTSGSADSRREPVPWSRLVAFTTLGAILQLMIFTILLFIPRFAVEEFGASEVTAGALVAIPHAAGLWAGTLGGYLSDRIGKVPVMLTSSLIAGPAIYLLSYTSPGVDGASLSWSIWVVLLVIGACHYAGMPVTESYIITHAPPRRRSTVLGIYYFASRGGPGLIMPAIGALIDNFGFNPSFTVVGAIITASTIIAALFLRGKRD